MRMFKLSNLIEIVMKIVAAHVIVTCSGGRSVMTSAFGGESMSAMSGEQ